MIRSSSVSQVTARSNGHGLIVFGAIFGGLAWAVASAVARDEAMQKIKPAGPRQALAVTQDAVRASVSLVVPTLSEAKYLPGLLDSAMAQDEHFVQVVIADSSPDEDSMIEIAESYEAQLVRYPKGNISSARNAGAAAVDVDNNNSDILVFADADVLLPHDFVTQAIDALYFGDKAQSPVAVHPREVIYDSAAWNMLWYPAANLFRAMDHTARCVAVRSAAFWDIGGYDPDVNPVHGGREDLDLGRRLQDAYGPTAVGVLDTTIATSSRREQRFGLRGIENWSTPVR